MRKFIALFLTVCLIFGLSACAYRDGTITNPGTNNGTTGNGTNGFRNGTTGNGTYGNGTYGNGTTNGTTTGNGTYGNGTNGYSTYGNGGTTGNAGTNNQTGTNTNTRQATTPQDGTYTTVPPAAQQSAAGYSDLPSGGIMSTYSTKILDYTKNRIHNIKLCINKLKNIEIKSGEEFSFNKTVGRRTEEKGYREAIIFKGDKKEKEIGGGICQVSTTIYNAALEAGLEITERHIHSQPVTYVAEGRDATVMYGSLDLKFKNNAPFSIILDVDYSGKSVDVTIKKK